MSTLLATYGASGDTYGGTGDVYGYVLPTVPNDPGYVSMTVSLRDALTMTVSPRDRMTMTVTLT